MVDVCQGSARHAVDGPDVAPSVHHQRQAVDPPGTVNICQRTVQLSHLSEHHKELQNKDKGSSVRLFVIRGERT